MARLSQNSRRTAQYILSTPEISRGARVSTGIALDAMFIFSLLVLAAPVRPSPPRTHPQGLACAHRRKLKVDCHPWSRTAVRCGRILRARASASAPAPPLTAPVEPSPLDTATPALPCSPGTRCDLCQ